MASEYVWASPGGLYVVPDIFRQRLQSEFPGYRVRWSLKESCWQIEQPVGGGALPPLRIDPADDSLIRARDGYWLVMKFQPGDRMACPQLIQKEPRQECSYSIRVPHRRAAEVACPICRAKGRDGRTIAAYWPFDETLLEQLRLSDPLRGGIQRQSRSAEANNAAIIKAGENKAADAMTSLDQVDYRWLSGIGSSTGKRRQIDHTTFR